MVLPSDIARITHAWQRLDTDAWTSAAFRSPVIAWLDTFLLANEWASSISVVEKFHEAGIHRRVPFGSSHRAEDPRTIETGFRQSDALPILLFTAVRGGDLEEFETAASFPDGALTGTDSLDFYLGQARAALEAEEARRPLL